MNRGLFIFFILTGLFLTVPSEVNAAKRVALVIGNSSYSNTTSLKNPANDAQDVSNALERLGFDVVNGLDLTSEAFVQVLIDFFNQLKGADVALLYYAGHGLQLNQQNYLVPVDAKLQNEFTVKRETFRALDIIERMEAEARVNLVFLDACRDNPLADNLRKNMKSSGRSASIGRGLARIPSSNGETLLVYAAAPGTQAQDGTGRNSPFTKAFLNHIESPGTEIEVMLKRVTKDVRKETKDKQRPERLSKLTIEFYFKEEKVKVTLENESQPAASNTTGSVRPSEAMEAWTVIKDTTDKETLQAYIDRYGSTFYATLARNKMAKLEEKTTPSKVKPSTPSVVPEITQPISAICKVSLESWRSKASIGAFALSKEGACGWSWRHKTMEKAEASALENCKKYGSDCKIVASHKDQKGDYSLVDFCRKQLTEWHKKAKIGAFAVSRDGACGWSFGYKNVPEARKRAIKECSKYGPECIVTLTN